MQRTLILFLFLGLSFPRHTFAQIPVSDSCKLRIGTNLSGPVDYGSEYPFVNIMKYGRKWIAHNSQWVSGGQNPWDSGLLDQIPLDAEGYPLSLPVDIAGAEAPQIVRTLWANTEELPEGRYVVLYDGEGELGVWGDASLVSQSPGRMEFDLSHGNDIFTLELLQSKAGNHIRNMRVLLPGTEDTYLQEPFSAPWLEKLEPFGALRFMDWGYTNNSTMREWNQRTHTDDYTWTQKSGVPYEWWITLCNRKKADAWICIPHAASDDYIIQMATMFRDQLDPEQKIYVEYSNEVWNWIFEQAHYGLDSLDQNLAWPERLGPRIAHVMQLWTNVFAGQEHRLVRIMASQHAWWDLGYRTFAQIKAEGKDNLIDAISPAAYMGLDGDVLNTWDASATGQQVLDLGADFTFNLQNYAMQGWHAYAQLAHDNNKQLVFYEGGQHFTPNPFGSDQPYCQALLDCQTMPGMYDLYQRLFDTLRTLSDREMLLMNFSFISPKGCKYGSWGVLQSQFFEDAPYANAPKYRAILEANERYLNCKSSVSTYELGKVPESGLVFPNPASNRVHLELPYEGKLLVRLFTSEGRQTCALEMEVVAGKAELDLSALSSGVYRIQGLDTAGKLRLSATVIR